MGHPLAQKGRLTTPKGIKYAVIEGPTIETVINGTSTARAVYQVLTSRAVAFANELAPVPVQKDDQIRLQRPLRLIGTRHLTPTKVMIEPFSGQKPIDPFLGDPDGHPSGALLGTEGTYDTYARVIVEFATTIDALNQSEFRTSDQPETFLEPSFSVSVEALALHVTKNTRSREQSESGGGTPHAIKEISAPFVKLIPIVERSYRWTWALNPDFAALFQKLGTINGADALAFMPGVQAGTVMFLGVSGKQEWRFAQPLTAKDPAVISPWVLDYKFGERSITESGTTYGWNYIFNPDTQKFEELLRDIGNGNTLPLYASSDFNTLFRPKALT